MTHPMTAQPTDYISELRELFPLEWITVADDTWFYGSHPATPMAVQGWKIHISSRLGAPAIATLRATLKVCLKHRVNFKTARSPKIHQRLNAKQTSREASNKFITLYPAPELLSRLVLDLNAVLTADDAPIVLSDLQIGNQTHIRYGAHRGIRVLNPDGTSSIMIQDPRDGTLIADPRGPFFLPPEWITTNPITGTSLDDDDSDADIYALNEFTVIDALHFSTTGGVYRGKQTATGEAVVLKEGIRNAMYIQQDDQDAVDRLESEYKMLEHLAATGVTPKPFSIFEYEEHRFIAMEYIVDAPTLSETGRLAFGDALALAIDVSSAVAAIHRSGVVLGDLSSRNVLLPKSGGVKIIDLEGAYLTAAPPEILFATPGYAPEKRVKGTADDIYSLGAVLTTLFVGRINGLYDLDADPTDVAERFFKKAGMPTSLITLITECLATDAQARPTAAAVAERLSSLQNRLSSRQGVPTGVSTLETQAPVDMDMDIDIDRKINRLAACVAAPAFPRQEINSEGSLLGIADGIAGRTLTLQYLTETEGEAPPPPTWVERLNEGRWQLLEADLQRAEVPPGFANGLAGIAFAIHRTTDATGYAERLMKRAMEDTMLEDPNFPLTLMHGRCGIGLTALYFYKQSGEKAFLEGAVSCAHRLEDVGNAAGNAVLFFALADAMRGENADLAWCMRGRDCLKALAEETSSKTSKRGINGQIVDIAVMKSKQFFGDEFLSAFAMEPWEFSKDFIPDPSLGGGGLSGTGLAYLHRYTSTGETAHLISAMEIAKTVECFIYEDEDANGSAFPGAGLRGASAGLFGGACGALVFLQRLRSQQRLRAQPLSPTPFFPWEWLSVDKHDLTSASDKISP